ncbi:MFS transporter [Chitinimonas sp. BJB300]|uniref:MFS transporter n=1 Tax=Chitinimonas sp. BJB300 TaxID=1559339 RepID=UPI000C0CA28F|nr:MFS transporter [Chitinimonas sp. BJB300]PHV10081.1 MFS transporter [Chitinimonas sp. BJB300]TSJ89676.1 MFS transporter [Chitinimonas sp. BJB300]
MFRIRLNGLWRNPDFVRLWLAQGISDFGSYISHLALPLTAAVLLHASPMQMGVLSAIEVLPFALFSLHAGVLIDRNRRMPLMMLRDILCALSLLVVPIAAWGGWLSMPVLCVVGFLCLSGEVVGGSAHQSYVANLIGKDRLVEAHSKFMATASTAQISAPGLAGMLIHWFTAPVAILFNAVSFVVSALILRTIRAVEPPIEARRRESVWREIKAGLRLVWDTPLLRALAVQTCLWQLLNYMLAAVLVLFAVRELKLDAAHMGLSYMLGGLGSMLAALSAERLGGRFGVGPMVGWGFVATAASWLGFGFIPGGVATSMLWFSLCQCLFSFGATMFSIHYLATRAAVTPDVLLGRMIATMRFFTVAPAPLGALAGGALATALGLRGALYVIGGLAAMLAWYVVKRSPARLLRVLPRRHEEGAVGVG